MKLETTVQLRRDGTVIVNGLDQKRYVFKPEPDSGMVVCDIDHEPTIVHLLKLGGYFPANEADHDAANRLLDASIDPDDDDGPDDDGLDDDGLDDGALPIEAGTPPASLPSAARNKRAKTAS